MSSVLSYNRNMKTNKHITDIFKVLQDPIRVRIIEILKFDQERREFLPETKRAKDGFCPMDILSILHEEESQVTNNKLSYHLKELKENKIISLVKEGKRNFYLLEKNSLDDILRWISKVICD